MKKINILFLPFLACIFFLACQKTNTTPSRKPPVVNAGASQSIILPLDSINLTGIVTDAGSKVVGYLWSEVSGPNVPVLESEGSISTEVTGLVAGTYIFQLMATDTFGLTGVDTLLITVSPALTHTVTLTPSNNPDEFQVVGNTGIDYGVGNNTLELGAEAWTINNQTVFVHAGFRFDLSSIPSHSVISAKLNLFSNPTPGTANLTTPNYGTANAFYIQRINTAWDPTTVSWATQPSTDPTDEILIPQTNASTLDLPGIDVTAMVNTMITTNNYGFLIKLQNDAIYNSRIFCSSKYADATKHPQLVITY